jgi:hypothetical protein
MRSLLTLLLLVILAGCDSSPSVVGPETITYRVTSDTQTSVSGVHWTRGATDENGDLGPTVALPWEITVPYYEGLKAVSTQVLGGDVTLSILINDRVATENVFPPASDVILAGAVAGLPKYPLNMHIIQITPHAEIIFEKDGVVFFETDWMGALRDGDLNFHQDTKMAESQTLRIGKGAGEALVSVFVRSVHGGFHLFQAPQSEPYEMVFHLESEPKF